MYDYKTMLTNNNAFVPHMRAVVTSLNNIIMRLGDEKSIPKIMDYIASAHFARAVGTKELEEIGVSIKTTLKSLNRENFTPSAEEAFDKFWKNFLQEYSERLEKLKKDQKK
ncbi:Hypothetical protein NTJ_15886 [Nesidiocoris tenuis]|uniref:Globin domain-containing protein n=1 Tax=Nesidiocoris tenuis TaxID=355587 RepID=A0ABN7BGZ2_9HEMI|nr:Hypothetical protein NTJ_15886 [Nesidiocoris tenuis]